MIGRRWPGHDRGAFTAEFAAGLPALMLLMVAGLTAVSAVTTKGQCLDAAREGAIAGARGEPGEAVARRIAPTGAVVSGTGDSDSITITVRSPVRLLGAHLGHLTVTTSATAAREEPLP